MNSIEDRYSRIADLSEQIASLNSLIELHKETTADTSMVRQYTIRRDEFLGQLQQEFRAIKLTVALDSAA